jgi:pimeloyl-ACP methyl ester carboxylesterase
MDKFAQVDGLKLRYIEMGEGPAVLLLHGGSLGSSADVFLRNLPPLAAAGFRAIAFDQPGFGLSDTPADHSPAYRRDSILKIMDALGIEKAALVGHSQAGGPAVQIGLQKPDRVSHIVVLGTGSLLPPADDSMKEPGVTRQRAEEPKAAEMVEPTLADTRQLLEWNLFHTDLLTPEELELRHSRSIGACFKAHVARTELSERQPAKPPAVPLWQRLVELKMPLRLMFGRQDRSWAYKRAMKLKELYPQLDLIILEDCKHMVPWDAAEEWVRLAAPFLKG